MPARDRLRRNELAAAALAAATATLAVFGGSLRYFFSQDDFQHLARAAGLIPTELTPWRPVANVAFFVVMRAVADLHAAAYHAASLSLHALVAVLGYAYLRRWRSAPGSAAGTVLFAVHPALYTALYWIAAVNVLLAWTFALAALHAERASGARRWLAVPLFALALLSRESVATVPLALIAVRLQQRAFRWRDPAVLSLLGVAVLHAAWIAALGLFGLGTSAGQASPYHMTPRAVADNLLTYLGWTADFGVVTVNHFADVVDPEVFGWAWAVFGLWIAGALVPALRARGWLVGGAWFVLLLLPVLPLGAHTYHYYLYGPLLGAAWCAAAAFDAVAERSAAPASRAAGSGGERRGTSPAAGRAAAADAASLAARRPRAGSWVAAGTLGVLLTLNAVQLVRKIETHPFVEQLRADPTVDRAIIARNVAEDLEAARLPAGIRLRFWSPTSIQRAIAEGRDPSQETYWERNVRQAVFDGLGVRVLFPQVRDVAFVRKLTPANDSTWYAVYRLDGGLGVATFAMLDSLIRAHPGTPVR